MSSPPQSPTTAGPACDIPDHGGLIACTKEDLEKLKEGASDVWSGFADPKEFSKTDEFKQLKGYVDNMDFLTNTKLQYSSGKEVIEAIKSLYNYEKYEKLKKIVEILESDNLEGESMGEWIGWMTEYNFSLLMGDNSEEISLESIEISNPHDIFDKCLHKVKNLSDTTKEEETTEEAVEKSTKDEEEAEIDKDPLEKLDSIETVIHIVKYFAYLQIQDEVTD